MISLQESEHVSDLRVNLTHVHLGRGGLCRRLSSRLSRRLTWERTHALRSRLARGRRLTRPSRSIGTVPTAATLDQLTRSLTIGFRLRWASIHGIDIAVRVLRWPHLSSAWRTGRTTGTSGTSTGSRTSRTTDLTAVCSLSRRANKLAIISTIILTLRRESIHGVNIAVGVSRSTACALTGTQAHNVITFIVHHARAQQPRTDASRLTCLSRLSRLILLTALSNYSLRNLRNRKALTR